MGGHYHLDQQGQGLPYRPTVTASPYPYPYQYPGRHYQAVPRRPMNMDWMTLLMLMSQEA